MAKKVKLAIDSITAFSFLAVRLMSWLEVVMALAGFLYAVFVVYNARTGPPRDGLH